MQLLTKKGLKANEWISSIQALIDGKGGGKDVSAQATGVSLDKLDQVVKTAHSYAVQKLGLVDLTGVLPIKDQSQANALSKKADGIFINFC